MTFGARLSAAMADRGRLCAGIDPHPTLLHAWGLNDDPAGLERFALTAVAALAHEVSILKPQSAFFERHGSRGIQVLERVIAEARAAGALILLDVKRGDIGSTSAAYADAYLDPSSSLAVDAVTVNPFLGFGSLRPFFDAARRQDKGVFVLALTSNPDGPQFQHARTVSGATVAGTILAGLRTANAGARPLGSFGAVVGATIGGSDEDLDINGPLLAPGYGAQGASMEDLSRVFGPLTDRVLPATSRALLEHGPDPSALREVARRANRELTG